MDARALGMPAIDVLVQPPFLRDAPPTAHARRNRVLISVTVGDVLDAGGKLYPDASAVGGTALIAAYRGHIPCRVESWGAHGDRAGYLAARPRPLTRWLQRLLRGPAGE